MDAIEPDVLRTMVRQAIVQHIDRGEYDRMTAIEEQERATLLDLYMRWPSDEGAA